MTEEHTPTEENRKKIESYAAVGIPQEDIAKVIGIDPKTMRKHYREVLDVAAVQANAAIGGALYNKAKGGDTTAMIWWTKARMRWSEKKELEHSGEIDGELTNRVIVQFSDDVTLDEPDDTGDAD